MNVNRYQFDNIVSKTKKMVSPIKHGEEDGIYFNYLALLEIHMHQFYEKHTLNGRQAKEILQLALFDIKSEIDHEEYDCSKFEEPNYRECADILGLLYLPEKNAALKKTLKTPYVEDDDFFEFPRKNLIRIYESVDQWTKDGGSYGYFNFISNFLASGTKTPVKFLIDSAYIKK